MFHPDRSYRSPALLPAMFVLLAAIFAATVSTVWLVVEVRKERELVEEILAGHTSAATVDAMVLSSEVGWQAVLSWLVLGVLVVAALALVLMVRAYLTSQRSLRNLQALSLDVLASMDKAVITVDHDGIITSVNPASLELIGIGPGSVGRPLAEVSERTPIAELARQVLQKGQSISDQDVSVERSGRLTRFRVDGQLLKDADGQTRGAVIYASDVTERSLLEERMRRMERYMGLGSLAAGLHHEIKNPLGALSLHVQLLEEKLDNEASDGAAEHLQVLKTEVTRIGEVLESFRDFASSSRLNLQRTDLCALVGRAIRLMQPQAAQQSVVLRAKLPENGTISAEADAARLEQVLLNLLLNSTEAMRDGGVVTVRPLADRRYVHVEVADTGCGIPESVLSRVYDPYFTTKPQGSGMGLALCQKIIQQHGGTIDCETSPEGTVFRFSIPKVAVPDVLPTYSTAHQQTRHFGTAN